MIFALLDILKFLCLIFEFILNYILKKGLNHQIKIKESLIPTDFEKYNKFILAGKINSSYILCKLNLYQKEFQFFYKDYHKNIEISKLFQDLNFYKTNKSIYMQDNLLKFNIFENNFILNVQVEKLLINLKFNFNDKILFEQNDTLKLLNFNSSLIEGLIIENENVEHIVNSKLNMLCFDKDIQMSRTLFHLEDKIYDIDHLTNLLYNDWYSDKIILKDYFETVDNIYYTFTDNDYNHHFYKFDKYPGINISNTNFSFSY
jgi:hypothetical protein